MNISMIPNNDVKTIHASQNDTQRKWEFTPFANNKALVSDLPMYIKSLKGNTLVWNQLVVDGNFEGTSEWRASSQSITLTANNNSLVIHQDAGGSNGYVQYIWSDYSWIENHKYLITVDTVITNGYILLVPTNSGSQGSKTQTTSGRLSMIWNAVQTTVKNCSFQLRVNNGSAIDITLRNFNIYDLTLMFGSGNEPTTVDEFISLFPLPYYQFDSGSLLSFNGTGIKTVGFNLAESWVNGNTSTGYANALGVECELLPSTSYCVSFVGNSGNRVYPNENLFTSTSRITCNGSRQFAVLTTVADVSKATAAQYQNGFGWRIFKNDGGNTVNSVFSDVCVNFNNASRNGEYEPYTEITTNLPTLTYFPNGMRSAGSVYDELTPSKAITRIGAIDLGTLTWSAGQTSQSGVYRMVANLSDIKNNADSNVKPNVLCSKYQAITPNQSYLASNVGITNDSSNHVIIYDSNYNTSSSTTSLKESLNGVYLYYELATPTEENVDLNLTYPIEDGGTEELLPSGLMNGSVDLGSLTWTYASNYKVFICDSFTGAKGTAQQTQVPNMECAIYRIGSWSEIATDETKDMAVCLLASANQLRIRNLAYTDATTFKNAMNGITLWYEKSDNTPTTSPIRMDVVEPNGDDSTESFTFKATDASFANGTYTMVCKNLEIPLTVSKGKLTGTSVIGMTNEPGFFDAKLKMTDSDGVCYSTKFQLHVERKP